MACLIRNLDKRTGITYVYSSISYWDKDKKKPGSHRTLIGKIDPVSGNIIPTKGTQKNRKSKTYPAYEKAAQEKLDQKSKKKDLEQERLSEQEIRINQFQKEAAVLIKSQIEALDRMEEQIQEQRKQLDAFSRRYMLESFLIEPEESK